MPPPEAYTVGWICAIDTEFVAAQAFLDEEHGKPDSVAQRDNNSYALGRIDKHNVVIAVLPDGQYGKASAATVARDMLSSFPNIRIGLMVGIGGGVPIAGKKDIRLGDVVVSSPSDGVGGVFQYDFGKTIQDEGFIITGHIDQPPTVLRTAVTGLRAQYERRGHQLEEAIKKAVATIKRKKKYQRPPAESDRLFKPDVVHPSAPAECDTRSGAPCDAAFLIHREPRDEEEVDDPAIHYGIIASADQLMKNAGIRDKLATDKGVLCFEMEAAGLMNHFPCLVIRGICDYADSHKSKQWQGFAAMVAAAYAKDLLLQMPPNKIEAEARLIDLVGRIDGKMGDLHQVASATLRATETIRSDVVADKIERWLSPPDPSTNINHARSLRHEGTGTWLLAHSVFRSWLSRTIRHLWLDGRAGCGKTVLSTTILDHLHKVKSDKQILLSFYFDFGDLRKQTLDGLLRSLIFQLYQSSTGSAHHVDRLFRESREGTDQPSTTALSDTLLKMLTGLSSVSIILDALDESTTRAELLRWFENMTSTAELSHVQTLCTGRPEAEFRRVMPLAIGVEGCLALDDSAVDTDIQSYVAAQLAVRREFQEKRMPLELLAKIEKKVGRGAAGMFRWAACQLDSLARCRHEQAVEAALECLPRTLNETYRRMFLRIPDELRDDAMHLLQFLVHFKKPLSLPEAVDILATDISPISPRFDAKRRLFDKEDILEYCPGFLVIVKVSTPPWRPSPPLELHLSHFSVQEYLRTHNQMGLQVASISITKICLAYLSSTDCHRLDGARGQFPLADLASSAWPGFARIAEEDKNALKMILKFLRRSTPKSGQTSVYRDGRTLFIACDYGLLRCAQKLLDAGAMVHPRSERVPLLVAAEKGHRDIVQFLLNRGASTRDAPYMSKTALEIATCEGHYDIAKLLLEHPETDDQDAGRALVWALTLKRFEIAAMLIDYGADTNASLRDPRAEPGSSALVIASSKGYVDFVRLLLEQGARPKVRRPRVIELPWDSPIPGLLDWDYRTALRSAVSGGHLEIVRLLLDYSAPESEPRFDELLTAAAMDGNYEMVKLLIERRAGATNGRREEDEEDEKRLGFTLRRGFDELATLLLDHGAKVDPEDDRAEFGSTLQSAAIGNCVNAVKWLLRMGCDVNAQGGECGNALQAAIIHDNLEVVETLLENGAEFRGQWGGLYGDALQAASARGHCKMIEMFLERGAEVDDRGGQHGTALQAACHCGHHDAAMLLIESGADVNVQGGQYNNALQAASAMGHEAIVKMLLECGADVNAQATTNHPDSTKDMNDTALQAAASYGRYGTAVLLLSSRAKVNVKCGLVESVLGASILSQSARMPELLLEHGADPNSSAGKYWGYSLHLACFAGFLAVVKIMLDRGAEVNAQGGEFFTALQAAITNGHVNVVQLLLKNRADANAEGGPCGSPLGLAQSRPSGTTESACHDIVQLLLDHGAVPRD